MPRRPRGDTPVSDQPNVGPDLEWVAALERAGPVAGLPGPGRWLVARYQPTALFSLKTSLATSSVGKSLLIPTPYVIKMAFVDAAFRAGEPDAVCAELLKSLALVKVRVSPSQAAVVTHTFVKIRQESRGGDPLEPYTPNIAYRELVYVAGDWRWAFDLADGDETLASRLVGLAPHVSYVGKRGSFIQFASVTRATSLDSSFTEPTDGATWRLQGHIVPMDDFGPEATLDVLSTYSDKKAQRDRHRKFVHTVVPLGLTSTGPGFSEYRRT